MEVIYPLMGLSCCIFRVNGFPPAIEQPQEGSTKDFFVLASFVKEVTLRCAANRPDSSTLAEWRSNTSNDMSLWNRRTLAPHDVTITTRYSQLASRNYLAYDGSYQCTISSNHGKAVSGIVTVRGAGIVKTRNADDPEPIINTLVDASIRLSCSASAAVQIFPNAEALELIFSWFVEIQGNPAVTIFNLNEARFVIDDQGGLHLRNVEYESTRGIYNLPVVFECRGSTTSGLLNETFVSIKKYILSHTATTRDSRPVRLAYRSSDAIVLAGSRKQLSCIFYTPKHIPLKTVSWLKLNGSKLAFMTPSHYGSLIDLGKVTDSHTGAYQCTYGDTDLRAVIHVTVVDVPTISTTSLIDTYATVGQTVEMTCKLESIQAATFQWFFNGQPVDYSDTYSIRQTRHTSTLQVKNAKKRMSGAVACEASTAAGKMRKNVRLIISDEPKVQVKVHHNTNFDSHTQLTSNGTIEIRCKYRVDPQATNIQVVFKLGKKLQPIDSQTEDRLFGIKAPAVRVESPGVELLTLRYSSAYEENFRGNCTCIVTFKIFDIIQTASDTAQLDGTTASVGNYWWMLGPILLGLSMLTGCLAITILRVSKSNQAVVENAMYVGPRLSVAASQLRSVSSHASRASRLSAAPRVVNSVGVLRAAAPPAANYTASYMNGQVFGEMRAPMASGTSPVANYTASYMNGQASGETRAPTASGTSPAAAFYMNGQASGETRVPVASGTSMRVY